MTQQGDLQASIRGLTGTAWAYEGDFEAMFDGASIAAGDFNGRLLAWINKAMGSSYSEINGAKQAYAAALGFSNWNGLNLVNPYPGATVALDFAGPITPGLTFYAEGGSIYTSLAAVPGWSFTRASSKTALMANGSVVSFASGVPAITDQGILIEQASTNLVLWSGTFTNAAWTLGNSAGIAAVSILGPDGNLGAYSLTRNTSATTYFTQASLTTTASSTYTQFFIAKAGALNWIAISAQSTPNAFAYFNLSTGTVGTVGAGATAFTPVKLANGFWLCAIKWTAATTSDTARVFLAPADNTTTFTAGNNTDNVYLWGSQAENLAFPTSYIPTTSSAVTRAADVASVGGLSLSSAYTLFADGVPTFVSTGADATLVELDDGTTNNIAQLLARHSDGLLMLQVNTGGPNVYYFGAGTIASGARAKIAARLQASSTDVFGNGSGPGTPTAITLPTVTRLDIGQNPGGQPANGYVRRAVLWPSAFSDAQLQALTQ